MIFRGIRIFLFVTISFLAISYLSIDGAFSDEIGFRATNKGIPKTGSKGIPHKTNFSWEQELGALEKSSVQYLFNNLSPKDGHSGAVIASPSKSDPDYYFHWVRDAALVSDVLISIHQKFPERRDQVESFFKDYIELTKIHQKSQALTGLGEPKFYVDGSSFDGPWGRPQTDGPALRALALTRWANHLLDNGESDFVRTNLYDSKLPTDSVIKIDLEYISNNWRIPSFDLWEEVLGDHFYTLAVQYTSLKAGSDLAARLGDFGARDWYDFQSNSIEEKLLKHLNPKKQTVDATLNYKGGVHDKDSNLDAAIALAVIHTSGRFQSKVLNPSNKYILQTVNELENEFRSLYEINHNRSVLGPAIGRYPEDRYYGGNPWFLTTFGFAEYYYLLSAQSDDSSDRANFRAMGDALLRRGLFHKGEKGRMDEQMDRRFGYMVSARDLTWSYASFLTAIWRRGAN